MNNIHMIKCDKSQQSLRVGNRVTVRGVDCEVVKVLPLGTIDVAAIDPNDSRAFRVSGLYPFPASHEYIIAKSI